MKKHWSLVGLDIRGVSAEKGEEKELVQGIKVRAMEACTIAHHFSPG